MTYVFQDKAPLSYSDQGRPIGLPSGATAIADAEPIHDGQGQESGGRYVEFEELYLYLSNRDTTNAATVHILIGGSTTPFEIIRQVPAGDTVALYPDGRGLAIFGGYQVRAYATGTGIAGDDVNVSGYVQRARWED